MVVLKKNEIVASQSLVNEGRFPQKQKQKTKRGDEPWMSQSLVNEGRFPLFESHGDGDEEENKLSQSLVNEGRFPREILNLRARGPLGLLGRNPSLMRAGFHTEEQILIRAELGMVAIPR